LYDKVTNESLCGKTGQVKKENEIKNIKWRWINHTLKKPHGTITKHALSWNP
jgi:hypothetical protein